MMINISQFLLQNGNPFCIIKVHLKPKITTYSAFLSLCTLARTLKSGNPAVCERRVHEAKNKI